MPSQSGAELSALLHAAQRLTGAKRVSLKCETSVLETVYAELRGDEIVIHDGGETWLYIAGHSNTHKAWDDELVERLCVERAVTVEREFDGGDLVALRLERVLQDEGVADVVAAVGDLVDAVFDAHNI